MVSGEKLPHIQVSKLYNPVIDRECPPLTFEEVFYMATLGGGAYFGKVGSFQEGYEFDALVMDDSKIKSTRSLTPRERAERMVYMNEECLITKKYVRGVEI